MTRDQVRDAIRAKTLARVQKMGAEMVRDVRDEISDPVNSRVTVNGWPLRRDTGALWKSIAESITAIPGGFRLIVGRGMKWYGPYWELTGRDTRKGWRKYPFFWTVWRRNYQKYMAILGVKPGGDKTVKMPVATGRKGPTHRESMLAMSRAAWRRTSGRARR